MLRSLVGSEMCIRDRSDRFSNSGMVYVCSDALLYLLRLKLWRSVLICTAMRAHNNSKVVRRHAPATCHASVHRSRSPSKLSAVRRIGLRSPNHLSHNITYARVHRKRIRERKVPLSVCSFELYVDIGLCRKIRPRVYTNDRSRCRRSDTSPAGTGTAINRISTTWI